MKYRNSIFCTFFFILLTICSDAWAINKIGRLGIGLSNQLKNEVPALSLKIGRSKSFAFGGLAGMNTGDNGGYGLGLKFYRIIFVEPQLNFYSSLSTIYLVEKTHAKSKSGFQFDLTLGSEFAFAGLDSLGFSLEFGLSFNKIHDFVVETTGHNFLLLAAHFYL